MYPSVTVPNVTFRAQDDLVLKRRPQKWNESDLDVTYEKRPPGTGDGPPGGRLSPWRESSLDGGGKDAVFGAGGHSATLPRNYKVSPLAGAGGGFRRQPPPGVPSVTPRGWPVSRIPVPPPGRPPRHKPLPLSMIFKLQNAFWEQGGGGGPRGPPSAATAAPPPRAPQKQPQPPALPPGPPPAVPGGEAPGRPPPPAAAVPEVDPEAEAEAEALAEAEGLPRPLSPTRLQPLLPAEVPALRELARALAQMPRPLKRRGSLEQGPGPGPPPARSPHYRRLIPRLLHRPLPGDSALGTPEGTAAPEPPGGTPAAETPDSPPPGPERRSALRDPLSPRRRPGTRVRLDPRVLLLDAALSGELDVVQQAVAELSDPSQPNEEGITALHNAICGANYGVVEFLIACGADVNAADSHGWTPLHCAASCNDTSACQALVRHGAAVFAATHCDGSLAADKCDPYRPGYAACCAFLSEVEQSMGVQNSGVVYALWDHAAELGDELSFREGEPVTVLRRHPPEELEWWWGSLYGHEGFVPRNYFGLFPRVRPQRKKV